MVAGLYVSRELLHSWRFATNQNKTGDEYLVLLRDFLKQAGIPPEAVKDSILASVVPALVPTFKQAFKKLFGRSPLIVDVGLDLGFKVKTDRPEEVGADRLVNAAAGYAMFGGPLIIVDFGTAITVDAVSRKGDYLGGAIAPGLSISIEALVSRTSRLPRIEMLEPEKAVGTNTVESMRSGIYYGAVGQIKGMIQALKKELGGRIKVIATGGYAHWIPARKAGIGQVVPELTLEGLRIIYERNSTGKKKKR